VCIMYVCVSATQHHVLMLSTPHTKGNINHSKCFFFVCFCFCFAALDCRENEGVVAVGGRRCS